MALTLTDDFNRANSVTLGGSWTEGAFGLGSALEIVSNAVKIVSGSAENVAYWTGTSGSDICSAFTIPTLSTVDYDPLPIFVTTGSSSLGMQFYMKSPRTSIEVWRLTGGVLDTTISLSQTFVAGDAICARVVDNGSTVTAYVYRQAGATGAWVEVGTAVLVGRDAGPYYPGIGIYDNTTTVLDDFYTGVGTPVVASDPVFLPRMMVVN